MSLSGASGSQGRAAHGAISDVASRNTVRPLLVADATAAVLQVNVNVYWLAFPLTRVHGPAPS